MPMPKMSDDLFIGQQYSGYYCDLGESPLWGVFYMLKRRPDGKDGAWLCHRIIRPDSPENGSNDMMLEQDQCHCLHKDNLLWLVGVIIPAVITEGHEHCPVIVWEVTDITRYDTDSLTNLCPVIKGNRDNLNTLVRQCVIDFLNTELQPDETQHTEHQPELGGSD